MKTLLLALLFLAQTASAAVNYVASSTVTCNNNSTSTATATTSAVTIAAKNTIFIVVAMAVNTTVSTITDQASNSYSLISGTALGTGPRVEIWSTGLNASVALSAQTITVNTAGNGRMAAVSAAYSGVAALGNTNTGTVGITNPTSPSITTLGTNSWCVSAYAGNNSKASTANTGNLRGSVAGGGVSSTTSGALADNIVAVTGGSCTTSITNAATAWDNAAVELRGIPGQPIIAALIKKENNGF